MSVCPCPPAVVRGPRAATAVRAPEADAEDLPGTGKRMTVNHPPANPPPASHSPAPFVCRSPGGIRRRAAGLNRCQKPLSVQSGGGRQVQGSSCGLARNSGLDPIPSGGSRLRRRPVWRARVAWPFGRATGLRGARCGRGSGRFVHQDAHRGGGGVVVLPAAHRPDVGRQETQRHDQAHQNQNVKCAHGEVGEAARFVNPARRPIHRVKPQAKVTTVIELRGIRIAHTSGDSFPHAAMLRPTAL